MVSHGIPRVTDPEPRSAAAVQRELEQIEKYKSDVDTLQTKIREGDFADQTLELCTQILKLNPEYYTLWNHRRRILVAQWAATDGSKDVVSQRIAADLKFLTPLMLKFPKCYWIWNYRLWLLEQATNRLGVTEARAIWSAELALVGKMLSRDGRNFHGWRYRRIVVAALESERLNSNGEPSSMVRQEFDYTTEMIRTNLSNFSAWHSRSKLVPRILTEEHANESQRQEFLDHELKLIHDAFIDPYDQSLWFYHACLVAAFDLTRAPRSIAPGLTTPQRLHYIEGEIGYVSEMLEDTDDCKWIYQTLIDLARLYSSQAGSWPPNVSSADVSKWMEELKRLDPLRVNRWSDMEKHLTSK